MFEEEVEQVADNDVGRADDGGLAAGVQRILDGVVLAQGGVGIVPPSEVVQLPLDLLCPLAAVVRRQWELGIRLCGLVGLGHTIILASDFTVVNWLYGSTIGLMQNDANTPGITDQSTRSSVRIEQWISNQSPRNEIPQDSQQSALGDAEQTHKTALTGVVLQPSVQPAARRVQPRTRSQVQQREDRVLDVSCLFLRSACARETNHAGCTSCANAAKLRQRSEAVKLQELPNSERCAV